MSLRATRRKGFLFLAITFFITSGEAKKNEWFSQNTLLEKTKEVGQTALGLQNIEQKLKEFQQLLSQKQITDRFWKLHDDLLDEYIRLTQLGSDTSILIPPGSRQTLTFKSFCLNRAPGPGPSGAAPHAQEKFRWTKQDPKIPYFREVLKYASQHPEIKQTEIQTLLWHLARGFDFEDYSPGQKAILLSIDPAALAKLPSRAKEEAKQKAKQTLFKAAPVLRKAEDLARQAQRDLRSYEAMAREVLQTPSKLPLDTSDKVYEIEGTGVYAKTKSRAFMEQTITFYNPGDEPRSVDPAQYYLQPTRSDVQRIGIMPPYSAAGTEKLRQELETALFEDMQRLGIGFVPVANDIADAYELLVGRDFVSGKELDVADRLFSGLGLIAGSGANYRFARRTIFAPEKYRLLFAKELEKIAGKQIPAKILGRQIPYAKRVMSSAQDIAAAAKRGKVVVLGKDPNYLKVAEKLGARKFRVPDEIWEKMSSAERWAANKKFLDRAILRGDDIILSDAVKNVKEITGFFRKELDYLIGQGYRLSTDGTRMIKP